MDNELQQFRQQIADHFSLTELEAMTFDLRLNWDELAGQTLSAKIISLITILHHQNRLPDLITYLTQVRSHLIWPTSIQIAEYLNSHPLPSAQTSGSLDRLPSITGDGQPRRSRRAAQERRNELALLHKVRSFWIDGVLNRSVHGMALLDLGKQEEAEAVDTPRPWEMVLEVPDEPERPLPPDSRIIDIYDELGGETERTLLILGAPGAGKTTTLLELARDTIARAEKQPDLPLPVIFNLSSWGEKQQPLADWLVEELNLKYQIPKKLGREWVAHDDLLLLLDGLDEIKSSLRDSCVKEINNFRQEHGLVPIVVCSRFEDYESLNGRLQFQRAIRLLPLRPQQIDSYLDTAGAALASLRLALTQDETLREMAQSPLMLSIMSLAYRDIPVETLVTEALSTQEARRTHLFDTYVDRMLRRRGASQAYTPEQTMSWLSWLAQNMAKHSQSVFLLEQLQPSWLSITRWRWCYLLLERFTDGLILYGILWAWLTNTASSSAGLDEMLAIPLFFIAIVMIIKGIVWWADLHPILAFESSQASKSRWRLFRSRKRLTWSYRYLAVEIVLGMIFVFICLVFLITFFTDLINQSFGIPRVWATIFALLAGGGLGLLLGLPTSFIFAKSRSVSVMQAAIRTREGLSWSWRRFGLKFFWFGFVPLSLVFLITSINYQRALRNSVLLRNGETGAVISRLVGHKDWVESADFSPDGRFILTASHDNSARLWDGKTGTYIATLPGHTHDISSASFSPDSRFILTGLTEEIGHLWQTETGAEIAVLDGHASSLESALFSPDGRFILTASRDSVRLWHGETGIEIAVLDGHTDSINSAEFSPNGRFILTASRDHTARLWQGQTGVEIAVLDKHAESATSAIFSPDGRYILTASGDNTARLWQGQTGSEIAVLAGHTEPINAIYFSPDGRSILTTSRDKTARLWDGQTGAEIATFTGHLDSVISAVFSSDGRFIVTNARMPHLWNGQSGLEIAALTEHQLPDYIIGLRSPNATFSPDNRFVLTTSSDNMARLWDSQTGAAIATLTEDSNSIVQSAKFSPDGRFVVTTGHAGLSGYLVPHLWDGQTGAEIAPLTGHRGDMSGAYFSPDGRYLLTSSERDDFRIWSLLAILPGLLIGALFGVQTRVLETKKKPNQGILLTLKNGLVVAIIGGVLISLPVSPFAISSAVYLLAKLTIYYVFVWFAGIYVMRHYILRLILILSDSTPRRYVHFLDYATDRIFLQKIGGGYYIFIHRLLLEYFASQRLGSDTPNKPNREIEI